MVNLVPSKDGKRMKKTRKRKGDNGLSADKLKKAGTDVLKTIKKNMQKNEL